MSSKHKSCALIGCKRLVSRRDARFCSAECSQASQRTRKAGASEDRTIVNGNNWELHRTAPVRIKSLDELVEFCDIDTSEWNVDRWTCGVSDQRPTRTSDGAPLFQVKAWMSRKRNIIDAKAEIAALREEAKKKAPVRARISKPNGSNLMLEVNIPDLHIGKLAWSEETGGENYDAKIAVQLFKDAVLTILSRVKHYKFDSVLFPVGSDLLHADTKQGTTAKGTPLDTDSRYQKNFGEARKAITWAIEQFRHIAPVRVEMVRGNHDDLSVWHLGDSLECYYHNTKDVTINNAPTDRKYVEWGKCMLLLCHGDRGKRADYPLLMATEQPEMFGRTRYREAHTGHTHMLQVTEQHGVRVRIISSLSAADAWHAENAFVCNQRAAEGFVWSKDEGLISTVIYTAPEGQ